MRFDRAIVLRDGRIGVSRRPLPYVVPGGWAMLSAGEVAPGTFAMFPALLEIQQRVAPWTRLFFAPEVWHVEDDNERPGGYAAMYAKERRVIDGRRYYRCNGLAWQHEGQQYSVSALDQPHRISRTVYHELFHNVSKHLSPAAQALLDAAVARGPDYPGEYAGRPEERKARLFELFAVALDEGLYVKYDFGSAEHVLAQIYRGDVAAALMASPKPQAAPGLLRRLITKIAAA